MHDITIAKIRAREEAATPGPWETDFHEHMRKGCKCSSCMNVTGWELSCSVPCDEQEGSDPPSVNSCWQNILKYEDAEFCAHARTDVPALLAALEESRGETKALIEDIEEHHGITKNAYRERAQLVAFLSRLFPSHWTVDPSSPSWPVVCIHSPEGQMCWHIAPEDSDLFRLPDGPAHYDGHSTEEKYLRLSLLPQR